MRAWLEAHWAQALEAFREFADTQTTEETPE
jgi:hypothetical protein